MSDKENNITTIGAEEGPFISVAGNNYRIIVSGKETDGNYAVIDMLVPPGGGPLPHAHKDIQEMFYVVDGEVEFKTEAGKYTAKKGALVNIPFGGAVHCFKNISSSNAHLLCTVIPAGLDEFFQQIGKPVEAGLFLPPQKPSPEDAVRLKALAEKYGQKMYPPDYLG